MATSEGKHITSMRAMERALAEVATRISGNQELAARALTNPVLAMEELGYSFPNDLRASIERRIRFTPDDFQKMEALLIRMKEMAGHPVNPESPAELDHLLFEELRLARPSAAIRDRSLQQTSRAVLVGQSKSADVPLCLSNPVPPQMKWAARASDPLEELRGAHPILEPLLEYRRIDATEPRFATREIYEMVRRGEARPGVTLKKVTITIKPHPNPEP